MDSNEYFLPKAADDEADLSAWSPMVPAQARVLRTNLFGDVFVVDECGAVHMLERAACSASEVVPAEEDFWRQVQADEEGWQLRPLVDECRRAGKLLGDGQSYAFTTLPVFGGKYTVDNIWVASWKEWFSFTANVFQQIKDLPDGATVSLKVID
jgi:T6SS immunity protein Tdi1, C-terminal